VIRTIGEGKRRLCDRSHRLGRGAPFGRTTRSAAVPPSALTSLRNTMADPAGCCACFGLGLLPGLLEPPRPPFYDWQLCDLREGGPRGREVMAWTGPLRAAKPARLRERPAPAARNRVGCAHAHQPVSACQARSCRIQRLSSERDYDGLYAACHAVFTRRPHTSRATRAICGAPGRSHCIALRRRAAMR
jgi:hypothetical protein